MATDGVEICTKSLILLGEDGIGSFEDGTDKSDTCRELYETTVETLLSEYPWDFATRLAALGRLTEVPKNQWKYFYQLPSTRMGNAFAIFNSSAVGALPIKGFEIFGNKLATNEEEIYIEHRVRPSEPDWPAYFTQLMIYAMCALLSEPITDDTAKGNKWQAIAWGPPGDNGRGGYSRTARSLDAQASPPEQGFEGDYSLIAARVGASR